MALTERQWQGAAPLITLAIGGVIFLGIAEHSRLTIKTESTPVGKTEPSNTLLPELTPTRGTIEIDGTTGSIYDRLVDPYGLGRECDIINKKGQTVFGAIDDLGNDPNKYADVSGGEIYIYSTNGVEILRFSNQELPTSLDLNNITLDERVTVCADK